MRLIVRDLVIGAATPHRLLHDAGDGSSKRSCGYAAIVKVLIWLVAWCLTLLCASCNTTTIETPPFAIGAEGPLLLDETGLVAGWELLGGPDADSDLRTGRFPDDFGVEGYGPDSNEIVVVWSALPCQLEPVGQVTSSDGVIQIEVTPGPNPIEGCPAMGVGYGFRLTLAEPVGDRQVSARLIDPVNGILLDYPAP
jgi:hypothetical protein